jgi:hypothetical protein
VMQRNGRLDIETDRDASPSPLLLSTTALPTPPSVTIAAAAFYAGENRVVVATVSETGEADLQIWSLGCGAAQLLSVSPNDGAERPGWTVNADGEVCQFAPVGTADGANLRHFELGHPLSSALFAGDPAHPILLVGYADGGVERIDLAGGRASGRYGGHSGAVNAITLSPDGRLAAVGAADGSVELIALTSWPPLFASLSAMLHGMAQAIGAAIEAVAGPAASGG